MNEATEKRLMGVDGLAGDLDEFANKIMDLLDLRAEAEEEAYDEDVAYELNKKARDLYDAVFSKAMQMTKYALNARHEIKDILDSKEVSK